MGYRRLVGITVGFLVLSILVTIGSVTGEREWSLPANLVLLFLGLLGVFVIKVVSSQRKRIERLERELASRVNLTDQPEGNDLRSGNIAKLPIHAAVARRHHPPAADFSRN